MIESNKRVMGLSMNIYIDESGSINNKLVPEKPFIIALVHVLDKEKLSKAYKRFVGSNLEELKRLGLDKMFSNNKFSELKGSALSPDMKRKFVCFFSKKHYFDVYYIKINNGKLTDKLCSNTARAFNFALKNALAYFIEQGYLPDEDCVLQLDERNEKTQAKYFLEQYLNTELVLSDITDKSFSVQYFDSVDNKFVQIADVFANLYYSELLTANYTNEFNQLGADGILKSIYEFPQP